MARKVFYSFHYQNDISRVMVVRNRWVTYGGQQISGIIDKAEFETVERNGRQAIEKWIDMQLQGTLATIVLIGQETLNRQYVQYEICESIKRNNAIIGVYINNIKDLLQKTSIPCPRHTAIGHYNDGTPAFFDDIADGVYDYIYDGGYTSLDRWVENAVRKHIK